MIVRNFDAVSHFIGVIATGVYQNGMNYGTQGHCGAENILPVILNTALGHWT
jgi:hypothetical protein